MATKIKEKISLVLKCVGMGLAVAVFVCLISENMQTEEALKILSLAVICLGLGVLSEYSNEKPC